VDPRTVLIFTGCFAEENLGEDPSGSMFVREISTQKALKDSDQFDLSIYKDFDAT